MYMQISMHRRCYTIPRPFTLCTKYSLSSYYTTPVVMYGNLALVDMHILTHLRCDTLFIDYVIIPERFSMCVLPRCVTASISLTVSVSDSYTRIPLHCTVGALGVSQLTREKVSGDIVLFLCSICSI